jgi:hypothetical protein
MFDMSKSDKTSAFTTRSGLKAKLQEDFFRNGYYHLHLLDKSELLFSVSEEGFVDYPRPHNLDIVGIAYQKRFKRKRLY